MTLFYRRLPFFDYLLPKTLEEALSALGGGGGARLLAGGTDLIPRLKRREMAAPARVIDLKGIPGLDAISYDGVSGVRIGALATISAIAESPVIRDRVPILRQAAESMASPQVRNRATLAGNICNAVPSADGAPALLALGAELSVRGPGGARSIPIDRFFTGPRETVLAPDEVALEILVPPQPAGAKGVYLKLSPRHSMDLAVVGVAAVARVEGGACKDVAIALGAVAPTPIRASDVEAVLRGREITPELIEEAARSAASRCSPIDDHRASREYRCDMVYVMTRRALGIVFAQYSQK